MAPVSDRSQANGHFLHHKTHQKSQQHKRNEESDAEPRARGGVRKHARGVVFAKKNQDAGTHQKPEYAETSESACSAPLPARARHPPTVPRPVHVFMSQQAAQFTGGRRRGSNFSGGTGRLVWWRTRMFLSIRHELTELNFTY